MTNEKDHRYNQAVYSSQKVLKKLEGGKSINSRDNRLNYKDVNDSNTKIIPKSKAFNKSQNNSLTQTDSKYKSIII